MARAASVYIEASHVYLFLNRFYYQVLDYKCPPAITFHEPAFIDRMLPIIGF